MKIQPEEQYKFLKISLPDGVSANEHSVLLHACCAPCSAAIVECMLRNGIRPTVYFSNSNIYPQQEFDIRKHELIRFLQQQDVPYVEDEYDHADWKKAITGLENEPERGSRCSVCFQYRLHHAACYAQVHGFKWLTTTLASSRWKLTAPRLKRVLRIRWARRLSVSTSSAKSPLPVSMICCASS